MQRHSEAHGMLAAARGLQPLVQSLRDRFDRERQLPRELVDAIGEAGLFGMWLPRSLGGPELDPLGFLAVIEELARQDGSVGWCTVIAAGYARLAGALDEDDGPRDIRLRPRDPGRRHHADRTGACGRRRLARDRTLELRQLHRPQRLGARLCVTHDGAGPRRDASGAPECASSCSPAPRPR